jgi:hypothetical protein
MARFWFYYFLKEGRSYPVTASLCGRTHGSILCGCRRISGFIETNQIAAVDTRDRIRVEIARRMGKGDAT